MIEITKEIENFLLSKILLGHYSEFGAIMLDAEFILVYQNNKIYLAHKSEFEYDGIFVRLKYLIPVCPCNNCGCQWGGANSTGIQSCRDTCTILSEWLKNNK